MTVALVLDELFLGHQPPMAHPERPERLRAIGDALIEAGLPQRATRLPVRAATDTELGRVHAAGTLAELSRVVPGRSGWIDEDTYFSPGTWTAALAAAGAAVDVTLAAVDGRCARGLAVVRPPGHHATPTRPMGFCLLNNVAVAAAAARAAGCARVAIMDFDVHHGNGTQDAFYADPTVMYVSTHQYPFYPGSGASAETGAGAGVGATVNVPLPAGCGDAEYAAAFDEVVVPALIGFRPDVLLVSAGFDPFAADPLAEMNVSIAGFERMARALRGVADATCEGRMVCVLEGGYDLDGLGAGAVGLFSVLEEERPAPLVPTSHHHHIMNGARANIEATKRALSWPQS